MFPFRLSSVFRNRWMAILWGAGICWTAVDFTTPDAPAGDNKVAANSAADGLGYDKADIAAMQDQLKNW